MTGGGKVVRWHRVADADALGNEARTRVLDASADAIARRGRFVVVLAGGNTPRALYESLREAATDWSRWDAWFGDERCVAADDPQRNDAMARAAWLDRVPLPRANIHEVRGDLDAQAAARDYAERLRGVGPFDLVLLGLGEDGHTASLFPGHDWGTAPDAPDVLPVLDAPKPPPARVSMSAARLGRARQVLFLVEGASKRDALAQWQAGAEIPAAAIRPEGGVDVLFVEG